MKPKDEPVDLTPDRPLRDPRAVPPSSEGLHAMQGNQMADPVVPWVLCIDDDADFSHALKLRLESRGVAVVRAYEGAEGFHSAFSNRASAILLDYHLPNGEGDDVLRQLKENQVTKDIPVIVVTGVKDGSLEHKMLNLGAEKVFFKPLDFDRLCQELARHVNILRRAAPGFELPTSELVY
ncbi:MAG: response regulator [Pirellulales bacterium]